MLQPHTATQQWQSFEMRMRRRRVDRCVLRAAVAIEAGVLEDARIAIEEVERLDPYEPAIDPLRVRLAAAEASPAAQPFQPPALEVSALDALVLDRAVLDPSLSVLDPALLTEPSVTVASAGGARRPLPASVAALLIVISGVGGWFLFSNDGGREPTGDRKHLAAAHDPAAVSPSVNAAESRSVRIAETSVPPAAAPEPAAAEAPESSLPIAAPSEAETAASSDRAAAESASPATPPAADALRSSALPASDPGAVGRPVPAAASASSPAPSIDRRALEPSPTLPEPPVAAPVPAVAVTDGVAAGDNTTAAVVPAASIPSPTAPAAASPPAAASSAAADESGVRAALDRYEAAYSALDAGAASAVWPGVDRRALTSAFQALASQHVSLGRCDVRVTGATAQADCRGTARWAPKVGAGPQTAARQWQFDLRNTGTSWIITRATVR